MYMLWIDRVGVLLLFFTVVGNRIISYSVLHGRVHYTGDIPAQYANIQVRQAV